MSWKSYVDRAYESVTALGHRKVAVAFAAVALLLTFVYFFPMLFPTYVDVKYQERPGPEFETYEETFTLTSDGWVNSSGVSVGDESVNTLIEEFTEIEEGNRVDPEDWEEERAQQIQQRREERRELRQSIQEKGKEYKRVSDKVEENPENDTLQHRKEELREEIESLEKEIQRREEAHRTTYVVEIEITRSDLVRSKTIVEGRSEDTCEPDWKVRKRSLLGEDGEEFVYQKSPEICDVVRELVR